MTVIPTEEDPLLSTEQIATICGISANEVRRWLREEKMPSIKINGRHRRVLKSELVKFLNKEHS